VGANGSDPGPMRPKWPLWKKVYVGVVSVTLAAAVTLTLLYWPGSPFRERYVSYDYSVTIEGSPSEEFEVTCSLPADNLGIPHPDVVYSVEVEGSASVSQVATPYGDGVKVVGTGSVELSWSLEFTYRTSTQSTADHYWNLSMLSGGPFPKNTFVGLEGSNVAFDLNYRYNHIYGSLGADFLRYQVAGNLTDGWNSVYVDFDWVVS
jgi:hypothetical protein